MKSPRFSRVGLFGLRAKWITRAIVLFLALGLPVLSQAQTTQTWLDANANNDWSLTALNWSGPVGWTNGNSASFTGTGETIEIASDITVKDITVSGVTSTYTLADANNDSAFAFSTGSTITVTNVGATLVMSEIITAGEINKAGAGMLTLSAANSFSGAVSVTAGTLRLTNNSALGSTTGATSVSGTGAIELTNNVTISGESLTVNSGGDNYGGLRAAANALATWAGSISLGANNRLGAYSGGLLDITGTMSGSGLVVSSAGSGTSTGVVRISSTGNTYSGNTTIIRGILRIAVDGALPSTTVLDIDFSSAAEDATFDLFGRTQTLGGLTRSGTLNGAGLAYLTNLNAAAATLTINNSSAYTYSGVIQDGLGLVNLIKTGSGNQTLSGNNTYTGTTTVSAGTLTMSGNNTLSGAITVNGGSLVMAGSNTLNAITVNSGSMSLSGSNTLNGNITIGGTVTSSLTLGGANTLGSGVTLQVTANGVLTAGNNGAFGAAGGNTISVAAGGRVVLQNGVTITGKTISIAGTGGNNNGALQSDASATATWAGNVITTSVDSRIGGGAGGILNVNGVISGSGGVLFSRGDSATTVLNAVNTYTGDTMLFASGGTGAKLIIGVDNALSGTGRLSVFGSVTASVAMTVDLNGKVAAFSGLDTSANHATGPVLFVQNNGGQRSTLTLSGNNLTLEQVFNGRLNDGTSGASGLSLIKNGSFIQTLVNANGYTGSTTLNAGTLQVGKATLAGYTGSNGALASTSIILNGVGGSIASTSSNTATLAIDNLGASNNSANRIADTAAVSLRGGVLIYRGSDQAATNSSETLGMLEANTKRSILTVSFGGTNTATLTFNSYSRLATGGTILVNGTNLGLNGTDTSSVSRIFFTNAPTLVGATAALNTGINSSAQNTVVVPGLLGESSSGVGTATGTANTFLTYNASTGLRPLDLATEFTTNDLKAGDNIYLTSNYAGLPASVSVNSLIIGGTSTTVTLGSSKVLTIASGNLLFASGASNITLGNNTGDVVFGGGEGIVSINSTGNTFFTSRIVGAVNMAYYGSGTLVTNQQNTYTGNTLFAVNTVIPQSSSQGSPGAPTSGPFGTGTIIFAGSGIRATSANNVLLHNNVELRSDLGIITGGGTSTLTFTGGVTLSTGTRVLSNNADANTYFSGTITETAAGSGITLAGGSTKAIVFSGNNAYTGATIVNSSMLVINGNQSAATGAVNVNGGTLGGFGTLGGALTVASGAILSPGDIGTSNASLSGTLSSVSSLTLKAGSNTNLQITTPTFTSLDNFGGHLPGTSGFMDYVVANGNVAGDAGSNHDKLIFSGTITQETGAKIIVTSNGFVPAAGQIFNLVDWGTISGTSFSTALGATTRTGATDSSDDLDLPDISFTGLTWDTSLFSTYGIIVITPEPGRAVLLALGVAGFVLRRRRAAVEKV